MICGGDELSRTQQGNNNTYCQDNELSWNDWTLDERRAAFLEFASRVARFRLAHPSFRRRSYSEQDPLAAAGPDSIVWFRADGERMADADWGDGGWMRTLGMYLDGHALEIRDREGYHVDDADFLLLLNAHAEPVDFTLPKELPADGWRVAFDTAHPDLAEKGEPLSSAALKLDARSFVVLSHER
jgi:glycogen operon protein